VSKKVTFVDTGVLIAAARGDEEASAAAFAVLDDPEREFASSDFVRLETIGPTAREGYVEQLHWYLEFFKEGVSRWATDLKAVVDQALGECMSTPIDPMDALHVAAAVLVGADELVTTEKPGPGRNITRTASLPVFSIHSAGRPNPTAGKPPAG
jgi:hypothetical protein